MKEKALAIVEALKEAYPDPMCALQYEHDYQLLIAVRLAAQNYDPSHINRYLIDLAAAFHKFYNACRIKGEAENVLRARLKLADTVRSVLRNGMELIGSSAPEKM